MADTIRTSGTKFEARMPCVQVMPAPVRRAGKRSREALKLFCAACGLSAVLLNCAVAETAKSVPSADIDLSNPDVRAIVDIANRFPAAIASGDVANVQDFYSPDVIYMAQGMHNTVGRENVWAGEFLKANIVRVEVHLQEVKVFGDMAFDRATFTTTVIPKTGGAQRAFTGRLLEILRKESGQWKSYRVMVNSG